MVAPLNGSQLIDAPWVTIFSAFVDLLGTWFYLIPISFIGVALYNKTRDPTMISMYLLVSGGLLASGGVFAGVSDMIPVYILITAAGFAGVIISLILRK